MIKTQRYCEGCRSLTQQIRNETDTISHDTVEEITTGGTCLNCHSEDVETSAEHEMNIDLIFEYFVCTECYHVEFEQKIDSDD